MKPHHHPSPDILAVYAAGTLEPGFGLVVGAHVEGCKACRARVSAYEAVSGAALAEVTPAIVRDDALSRVMARLDGPAPPPAKPDTRPLLDRLPLKPKKWVAPGVWVAAVDTPHAPENRVYLLSVAAGGLTARHAHDGREFCTVLKGAYRDELGRFAAGDFAAADGAFNHQPMVEGDEDCICLFATEGRLRPQGILARMAFAYANV
ncbi:transcriptional activator chrR [alpha proteobacterium U9-1i]|nr:transcriptional activator chrR [alpha proteobacterium U9-1i]